jgi:hypothetical protein
MPKTYRKYRGGSKTPRSSRRSSGRKSSGRRSSGRRSSGRKSSGRKSSGRKSPDSPWMDKRRAKKKSSPDMSPIFKKRMLKTQAEKDEKIKKFTTQSKIMENVEEKRRTGNYRSPRALRAEYDTISKMPGVSAKMAAIAEKLAKGNYLDST